MKKYFPVRSAVILHLVSETYPPTMKSSMVPPAVGHVLPYVGGAVGGRSTEPKPLSARVSIMAKVLPRVQDLEDDRQAENHLLLTANSSDIEKSSRSSGHVRSAASPTETLGLLLIM